MQTLLFVHLLCAKTTTLNEMKTKETWRRLSRSTWAPSIAYHCVPKKWITRILLRVSPKRITTPKLVVLVKQQETRSAQVFCGERRAYSSHPQFKDETVITSWCTQYEGGVLFHRTSRAHIHLHIGIRHDL